MPKFKDLPLKSGPFTVMVNECLYPAASWVASFKGVVVMDTHPGTREATPFIKFLCDDLQSLEKITRKAVSRDENDHQWCLVVIEWWDDMDKIGFALDFVGPDAMIDFGAFVNPRPAKPRSSLNLFKGKP